MTMGKWDMALRLTGLALLIGLSGIEATGCEVDQGRRTG